MATRSHFVQHLFAGGWSTDFGPTVNTFLNANVPVIEIPFLIDADNAIFELDGGPHKVPGTAKINTAGVTLESTLDVSGEDTVPRGLAFKSDGLKVYVVGTQNDNVRQYALSSAWDISSAGSVEASFDVSGEDTIPTGITFKPDGTKMFVCGQSSDTIHQYPLSSAWDISTAGAVEASFLVPSNPSLTAVRFKSDGSKLYVIDLQSPAAGTVNQFPISTPWDLSTVGALEANIDISALETVPTGLYFSSTGDGVFIVGQDTDSVLHYPLSTADDISTAGAVQSTFDVSAQDTLPSAIAFKSDGAKLYVLGQSTAKIYQYILPTAWSLAGAGGAIKGVFDAWFSGTAGTPTQHRILHVGATIKKDDADGSFADLFTGLTAGSVPAYSMMEDLLVMSNQDEVPKSWDGTTAQNLAGSPPAFAFSEVHKNRMWAAGDDLQPSRLYYSVLLDPADWASAGSGSIDIEPDDGDRITAIRSHKNELWVFKGPYKGSIHRITGSAPTGSDAFARTTFIKGIGAIGHNTLFNFRDDLGFMWSDGTIHGLKATASFGDFNEAALSRPINSWLREHLTTDRLEHAWAATWDEFGIVLLAVPHDTNQDPSIVLMMDYRFDPVRWAKWPAYDGTVATSIASVVDSAANNRRLVMGGGDDGFVRKFGQSDRSIDGTTAISYKVTTPHFTYGIPAHEKTISGVGLGLNPKNSNNVTFGWQRDDKAQKTETVSQGAGGALDSFVLGTDTLGGAAFVHKFIELVEGGQFRSVRYQVTDSINLSDIELHSIGTLIDVGDINLEN